MRMINTGVGTMTDAEKIVTIVGPDSKPIKALINQSRVDNKLVDVTYGRRTRAVIICENGYVILSPLQIETIADRIRKEGYDE